MNNPNGKNSLNIWVDNLKRKYLAWNLSRLILEKLENCSFDKNTERTNIYPHF